MEESRSSLDEDLERSPLAVLLSEGRQGREPAWSEGLHAGDSSQRPAEQIINLPLT